MTTLRLVIVLVAVAACGSNAGTPVGDGGFPPRADGAPPMTSLTVTLVPQSGVGGTQRINFAVPLPRGQVSDANLVRVFAGGTELASSRRALATYADGSVRSIQLQVELTVDAETALAVEIGQPAGAGDLAAVPVEDTLVAADGTEGPRVWAMLPAVWLAASGVAGPAIPAATVAGTVLDAFGGVCDYATHDTAAFLAGASDRGVWLYDRVTAMYRGYAITGDASPLRSAYGEAHIYRNGLSGTGHDTRIGIPTAEDDIKYHYSQGLAIHYLMTGDERFREAAEDVAVRASDLWASPGYAGGDDFWTERAAGFALLAYVWAEAVSDDQRAEFAALADTAVTAYLDVMATYPVGYADADYRCFAHSATAHGEDYGYFGCSPWMSAILADGLDAYVDARSGAAADAARAALVKLGRIVARDGLDGAGKPFYWMGVGTDSDEVDEYDEHWGEPAYVVALAYHHGGRTDATLKTAAEALLAGLVQNGSAPHVRSFNWQCRSAPLIPYYLQ